MNKILLSIIILMCLTVVGFSTYTGKIAYANNNVLTILTPLSNTTMNYTTTNYNITQVQPASDGTRNLILTTKAQAGYGGAGFKVFEVNENGFLINTFSTATNIYSCGKTSSYYYCLGDSIYRFEYDGTLFDTTTSFNVGGSSKSCSPRNDNTISINTNDNVYYTACTDGDTNRWLTTRYLSNNSWKATLDINLWGDNYEGMRYVSVTEKIEIPSTNLTIFSLGLNPNGVVNSSINSSFTSSVEQHPKKLGDTDYYITTNGTTLFISNDIVTDNYSFNLGAMYGFLNAQRFYTDLFSVGFGFDDNYLVIQSTITSGDCPGSESIDAFCVFADADGNAYYSSVNSDKTTITRNTIKIGVRHATKEFEALYSNSSVASAQGFKRPFAPCWDISEVGATGLGGLDYDVVYSEIGVIEGVQLHVRTENAKYRTLLLDSYYFKGWNKILGNDLPVLMAGRYATPIILELTPEVDSYDPASVTWSYAFLGADIDKVYNDLDGNNIWEDNVFYLALAYNTSHYMIINNTWTPSMEGWNKTYEYVIWADLRARLEAYTVPSDSINELLTAFDFTTPYSWITESNKILLKGYAWGKIQKTNNSGSPFYDVINEWKSPVCAKNGYSDNVFAYKCDSSLIDYSRWTDIKGEATFCNVAIKQKRDYILTTPGIQFFPYMNSNITENAYTEDTLKIGDFETYNYNCTSEYGEIISGAIDIDTQATLFPLFFNEVNAVVGLNLSITNRDNFVLSSVYVTMFDINGTKVQNTKLTNNKGHVAFNYLKTDTNYIINLKSSQANINYTITIGDSRNSQRLGTGTFCSAWGGYYQYTLILNPILKDVTFRVKCENLGVPDAQIYIDDILLGVTDSNGILDFETNSDGHNFDVDAYSRYGNGSWIIFTMEDNTFNIPNCEYSEMIEDDIIPTQIIGINEIISTLFNPMIVAFILTMIGAMAVGFYTGSIELSLITIVGLLLMFYFVGMMPVSAIIILVLLIAGMFAYQVMGR